MLKVEKKQINETWSEFTLSNEKICVSFLNFGGIITKIIVPDKFGERENIVLAYNDYNDYIKNPYYLGAIIGRVAGRVNKAEVTIGEARYLLEENEGNNHLHGGTEGFHNVLWDGKIVETEVGIGVELSHMSPQEISGYPGNVQVKVTYMLTEKNEFHINYEAMSDVDTVLSLTNHTYFNLSGNLHDTVENHKVKMNSNKFLALDRDLIAVEVLKNKEYKTFDFRAGRKLKEGFTLKDSQTMLVGGYDHYFIFDGELGYITVHDGKSGRNLSIETNQPGMVLYTANDEMELNDSIYKAHSGVCFETQASPAAIWLKELPSISLDSSEKYNKKTIITFTTTH